MTDQSTQKEITALKTEITEIKNDITQLKKIILTVRKNEQEDVEKAQLAQIEEQMEEITPK